MANSSKADLLGILVTSLLGASDKIMDNIEKGVNDFMGQTTAAKPKEGDFEKDLSDAVGEDLFEVTAMEAVRIEAPHMNEALRIASLEVGYLEAEEYEISSISTAWEQKDSGEWVAVSYITYS